MHPTSPGPGVLEAANNLGIRFDGHRSGIPQKGIPDRWQWSDIEPTSPAFPTSFSTPVNIDPPVLLEETTATRNRFR